MLGFDFCPWQKREQAERTEGSGIASLREDNIEH